MRKFYYEREQLKYSGDIYYYVMEDNWTLFEFEDEESAKELVNLLHELQGDAK